MLKAYYVDLLDADGEYVDTLSVNADSMDAADLLFQDIANAEIGSGWSLYNYRAVEDIAGANDETDGNGEIAWAGEVKWHGVVMGVLTVNAATEADAYDAMAEIAGIGDWRNGEATLNVWEFGLWAAFSIYMVEAA